jgi:tetratricopeptide (TPR) repeat protein
MKMRIFVGGEGFVVGLIGFVFGWMILGLVFLIGQLSAKSGKSSLPDQIARLHVAAFQAVQKKRFEEARSIFEKAHHLNPEFNDGNFMYASFLNSIEAFDDALRLAERLRGDDRYHRIRGLALLGQKKTNDALSDLLEANKIDGSDPIILNAIGDCYLQLGRKDDARNALNASLKLAPAQPAVKKLLQGIDA